MNLPNKITLLRLIIAPLFMSFLLFNIQYGEYLAAVFFTIAAFTDTLDGYIARKQDNITTLGKFIDPLADKILISAALVTLTQMGSISAWTAMIIIAREFAVTGFRTIAVSEGIVIPANNWGKAKTISQVVAVVFVILELPYGWLLMDIAVALTLISGAVYLINSWELLE